MGLTHFSTENWIFWNDKLNSTIVFTLNSNLKNGHYWRVAKARATTPLKSIFSSSHIVFALAFCSHHNCQQCKSSNGKRREPQTDDKNTERARDTSFGRYHQTANPRTQTQTQEAEDAINNKLATKEPVTIHFLQHFNTLSNIFDFNIMFEQPYDSARPRRYNNDLNLHDGILSFVLTFFRIFLKTKIHLKFSKI